MKHCSQLVSFQRNNVRVTCRDHNCRECRRKRWREHAERNLGSTGLHSLHVHLVHCPFVAQAKSGAVEFLSHPAFTPYDTGSTLVPPPKVGQWSLLSHPGRPVVRSGVHSREVPWPRVDTSLWIRLGGRVSIDGYLVLHSRNGCVAMNTAHSL